MEVDSIVKSQQPLVSENKTEDQKNFKGLAKFS